MGRAGTIIEKALSPQHVAEILQSSTGTVTRKAKAGEIPAGRRISPWQVSINQPSVTGE